MVEALEKIEVNLFVYYSYCQVIFIEVKQKYWS